jgi:hypothetical protein
LFIVDSTATAGIVRFAKAFGGKAQLLPIPWVKDLPINLTALEDFTQSVIDKFIEATTGIPVVGASIATFLSEVEDLFNLSQDTAGGLDDVILTLFGGGTVGTQLLSAVIPTLAQTKITGLVGDLAALLPTTTYQGLLNALAAVGSGGNLSQIAARLAGLTTGGLFDSSNLTNIANIPAIAQSKISGLGAALAALLPSTTFDSLLTSLYGGTSIGTTLLSAAIPTLSQAKITGLASDLAALLPISWFNTRQTSGTNLATDPTFENTSVPRSSGVYSTDRSHSGTRSLKVTATSGAYTDSALMINPDGSSIILRVKPGDKFYLESYVWANTGNTGSHFFMYGFFDDSKGVLPQAYSNTTDNPTMTKGAWVKHSGYVTVPAGYDRMGVSASVRNDNTTGDIFYIDDAMVREETASKNIIDTLGDTLALTSGGSYSLLDIAGLFSAFPNALITGYGGPGNAAATWQATWDQIISGSVGTIGTGSSLSDLFNIFFQISSNAAQGPMAFNLFGGLNNTRAFFRGRLPSSDTTLPIAQMMFNKNTSGVPTTPTFSITQAGGAYTVWQIIQQDATKAVLQWRGHLTGSNTDFRVRVLKMSATNGTVTPQQVSGNLIGALSVTPGDYATWTFGTPIDMVAGDIMGYEFQLIGSGAYNMVGDQTWDTTPHPTVFPQRMASIRSGSGTNTALGSSYAHLSGFAYTDKIGVVECAISTGNPPAPHAPQLLNTTGVGSGTVPVPDWANTVQLIVIPGGGKGYPGSSTAGIVGQGGQAGTIGTLILTRGTHFTTGAIVDYNAGAGSTGSGGGTSSAGIGANTVSRTGGTDGSGWTTGSAQYGQSPGTTTVDSVPYQGGAQQTSGGADGNVAGGGGAGGGYGPFFPPAGGNGARGIVWIRFKQ